MYPLAEGKCLMEADPGSHLTEDALRRYLGEPNKCNHGTEDDRGGSPEVTTTASNSDDSDETLGSSSRTTTDDISKAFPDSEAGKSCATEDSGPSHIDDEDQQPLNNDAAAEDSGGDNDMDRTLINDTIDRPCDSDTSRTFSEDTTRSFSEDDSKLFDVADYKVYDGRSQAVQEQEAMYVNAVRTYQELARAYDETTKAFNDIHVPYNGVGHGHTSDFSEVQRPYSMKHLSSSFPQNNIPASVYEQKHLSSFPQNNIPASVYEQQPLGFGGPSISESIPSRTFFGSSHMKPELRRDSSNGPLLPNDDALLRAYQSDTSDVRSAKRTRDSVPVNRRSYHSDEDGGRRSSGGARRGEASLLRRMYHSMSDYGVYPGYLQQGLGLSTITPSTPPGSGSVSGSEDFEWVRQSPMLTGLLEGHVTRLATPPDLRHHHHHHHRTSNSSLATPPESGEEATGTGAPANHRQPRHYPRPPPAPRPRTLDPGDLLPHRSALRDSRERVYTPTRDHHAHRRSRDSSSERLRETSCDRASSSVVLHQSQHHPHHPGYHGHHYPARSHCECVACCADEDEAGYDSCSEERHHRHSYHEGLHHQPGHHQPGHQHHHHHQHHLRSRDSSRDRRAPSRQGGGGPPDSGRSSPCCCRSHLGSCSSLSSPQQDYYSGSGGGASKGVSLEERVQRLEGDKDSLQLQVTVLTEQVEAQTEKIHDLENLLDQKKALLLKTEEQLQKEVMTRSSLETQRLQLFSEISNLKLRQAACESENVELRDKLRRSDNFEHTKGQLLTSAQVGSSPSPSTISTLSTIPASSPNKASPGPGSGSPSASPLSSNDVRDFSQPRLSKTPPPNARRKIDQFGTLPRNTKDLINHDGEINHGSATTGRTQKGVMFGRSFHFLPFRVAGKRSTSAPNLAETERQMLDDLHDGGYLGDGALESQRQVSSSHVALTGSRSPPTSHKTTGIKKIFTRLRRSSSGQIEAGSDLGDGDFKRGGTRSTASARLGWTTPINTFKEPSNLFNSWNIDTIDSWLSSLGLNQYIAAVRTWTEAGHHLSKVTSHQLERELGFRHPLHKKKIQLAISARLSGEDLNTPLARLDHTWVLRWLDDIGLPQYKDAFSDGRIDGRVLNCLTYDDLAFLRFANLLHVTSLKRGIQVLRMHNFDCTVLKRRSVPEEGQRHRTPTEVALWTNHRVMEWLRTVDLSEYAPNLRGSGVHGALMVYEVRFTSELLAAILSIPSSKTLLRRHLNTHFKELVGQTTVQEKRELQASTGYQPLTTSSKVKMPKKSQFSLKRKKSKSDLEFDDLLCPLDEKVPQGVQQDKEKETNGDGRLC